MENKEGLVTSGDLLIATLRIEERLNMELSVSSSGTLVLTPSIDFLSCDKRKTVPQMSKPVCMRHPRRRERNLYIRKPQQRLLLNT